MDAIEFLTEQHRETESLFEQFEEAGDLARRGEIAEEIIQDLELHTTLEEAVFYPAVRDSIPEMQAELLEDFEEHHAVELLLKELGGMNPSDERFDAKVTVVKTQVQHHIQEEENDLFPRVRSEFGSDQLNQLGQQLQQRAQALKSGVDPGEMTKAELYERAQELDVEGRSKMQKEELAEAVVEAVVEQE